MGFCSYYGCFSKMCVCALMVHRLSICSSKFQDMTQGGLFWGQVPDQFSNTTFKRHFPIFHDIMLPSIHTEIGLQSRSGIRIRKNYSAMKDREMGFGFQDMTYGAQYLIRVERLLLPLIWNKKLSGEETYGALKSLTRIKNRKTVTRSLRQLDPHFF